MRNRPPDEPQGLHFSSKLRITNRFYRFEGGGKRRERLVYWQKNVGGGPKIYTN